MLEKTKGGAFFTPWRAFFAPCWREKQTDTQDDPVEKPSASAQSRCDPVHARQLGMKKTSIGAV